MSPIDQGNALMAVGSQATQNHPGGSIQLSVLIEYVVQRTYHELTVLSELLPRKQDIERKIEIVQFASRTRQLFVRLLAVVKWANNANKVKRCAEISGFLDQQAMLFVDTADRLAQMARETLVQARLPSFSLPCAIDVLTTGSYPRLPSCIKEKIVPPEQISNIEKRQTLIRLNQLIEHRIVTNELPSQMRYLKIENGKVTFTVHYEFCASLTLMGDGSDIPWRLLDIEILVEDPETGDGKALVHSLQVNYIHQLIQSRLIDNDSPLHDLYNCLHSFCQSLQLEVLHSQALRLVRQRLGDHIRIEEYSAGSRLTISYWRNGQIRDEQGQLKVFKFSIHLDNHDHGKPLQISHHPPIHGSESIRVSQTMKNDYLSLEKLLIHTIQVRSMAKLKDLEREFRCIVSGTCTIQDIPTALYVPLVDPCLNSEKMSISVDVQLGTFIVSMTNQRRTDLADVREAVNGDRRGLKNHLSKLRLKLGIQRCEKSLQYIPVSYSKTLPVINLSGHPLDKLDQHRLYISIPDQSEYLMVVEVCEDAKTGLDYKYYLLNVTSTTFNENREDLVVDVTHCYYRAGSLVPLDEFTCIHGPSSKIHDPHEPEVNHLYRKRRLISANDNYFTIPGQPLRKKPKMPEYYNSKLVHIVAMCNERIPLVRLGDVLFNHGIAHQGVQTDPNGSGLSLTLLDIPDIKGVKEDVLQQLRDCLLSCKIMMLKRGNLMQYAVESIFTSSPLVTSSFKEKGELQRVSFTYEMRHFAKLADNLIDDWTTLALMYGAVINFTKVYNNCDYLKSEIEVKSFSYKRLTLAYGPKKCFTVTIQYNNVEKRFHLSFATCGSANIPNCHVITATQLIHQINYDQSIVSLVQTLLDTWMPLSVIGKIDTFPIFGVHAKPDQPTPPCCVVTESPRHLKLVYRNHYCLDIHCLSRGMVSIRDGAYSLYDSNRIIEGYQIIKGLKMFLNKYVDETVYSRHGNEVNYSSTTVRDNLEAFLSQTGQRAQNSPTSNPHTPSSPTTRMPMMGTPSPSSLLTHGSPNPSLHVPSPGAFIPAPSPLHIGSSGLMNSMAGIRIAPLRNRSAAHPTILTCDSFMKLMMAVPTPLLSQPPGAASAMQAAVASSPIERYIACVIFLKNLHNTIQTTEQLQAQPVTEFGVVAFVLDRVLYKVSMNPTTHQSLHFKITPPPDKIEQFMPFIDTLERFFERHVVCPPFKIPFLTAFMNLLTMPFFVLKDFVQIMKLHMTPDPNLPWRVQLCMGVPNLQNHFIQTGLHGIISNNGKVLFALLLIRQGSPGTPISVEHRGLPVALIYTTDQNSTKCAEDAINQTPIRTPAMMAIAERLKRYNDYTQHNKTECTIFPAVKDLITGLAV